MSAPAGSPVASVLRGLASRVLDQETVVGLGPGLVKGLGHGIEGLHPFPALSGPGCEVPSTQVDLWCWVGGADRGRITHLARAFTRRVGSAFRRIRAVDGSSFAAVQQWVHNLDRFEAMGEGERDNIISPNVPSWATIMPGAWFNILAAKTKELIRSPISWASMGAARHRSGLLLRRLRRSMAFRRPTCGSRSQRATRDATPQHVDERLLIHVRRHRIDRHQARHRAPWIAPAGPLRSRPT